ncbi:MAG: hypothetical protein GXO96_01195 [Nitrospirae bacterium]|nr:hypothetical protein [Candidatus Manganitrophaceae bacterium]
MIHIVVALIHEALTLITHYKMKTLRGKHPFIIYKSGEITLIVSGIGKSSAAAAVGYLQALNRENGPSAWLNIGIAGHQQLPIGQGFIAHRIQDRANGRTYYPPQVLPFSLPSNNLITVDCVEKDYRENSAYDMEAAAYYSAAIRSSTAEFVQSYKVVSDNPQAPVTKITKTFVNTLIENRIHEIKNLIATLRSAIKPYREIHAPHPQFDTLIQRWHFTETQKVQLKQLLQRTQVLFGNPLPCQAQTTNHTSAKTFLKTLSDTLVTHRLSF